MGRNETLWEKPLEVKPERFIVDGAISKPSSFTFVSFQAGPRICLGSDLAFLEAKLAMASIVMRYKLTLAPGQKIEGVQDALTMPHKEPMRLDFEKRVASFPA